MEKEFNLSEKIEGYALGNGHDATKVRVADIKEFIRLLKEEFWCTYERKFIDKLAGEKFR